MKKRFAAVNRGGVFVLPGLLVLLVALGFSATSARAAIVKIQPTQACQFIGLASSPATSQSGVYCNTGDTPFSLTAILNGTDPLYVGNSTTPSWNVINDTGTTLTSFTLFFSGALSSNSTMNMQVSGTNLFNTCTMTQNDGTVTNGCSVQTGSPVSLPIELTWSGGTGVAAGGTFNIGTASFAHAGADVGCISGTSTCTPFSPVPEPSTLLLVLAGMVGLLLVLVSRKRIDRVSARLLELANRCSIPRTAQ